MNYSIPLAAAAVLLGLVASAHADVRVDIRQMGNSPFLKGSGFASLSAPAIPGSSGPANASADEIQGQLRADVYDPHTDTTYAGADLSDEVVFSVPGTAPVTAYFTAWFAGSTSTVQGGAASGSLELLGINRATNVYTYSNRYLFDQQPCIPELSCVQGSFIAEQVTLAFTVLPGEQTVFLQAHLDAWAMRGSADFGHSAYLWLDVPEGVTWTPSTEGFLSLAAPVPEPSTYALMALGLALAFVARRRHEGKTIRA